MFISILIITYNHDQYIRKALEGLLMQTDVPPFEIIVCDDCSTDGTIQIISHMLKDMDQVSIHVNPANLGITKNYQQAFRKCTGEYIFVLEGDDYWVDPLKLKKQVDFLEAHPGIVMCAHSFYSLDNASGTLTPPVKDVQEPYSIFGSKDLILDYGIISNFSTACYRKNILERLSEDTYRTTSYEWMINISVGQFGSLARLNSPMSVYRLSSNGAWSNKTSIQQLTELLSILGTYDKILNFQFTHFFEQKKKLLEIDLKILQQLNLETDSAETLSAINRSSRWLKKLLARTK